MKRKLHQSALALLAVTCLSAGALPADLLAAQSSAVQTGQKAHLLSVRFNQEDPQNPQQPDEDPAPETKSLDELIQKTSIISMTVLKDGQSVDVLTEKDTADIQVILKNNFILTSDVTSSEPGKDPEGISIDRLSDGFSGGSSPEIVLDSEPQQALRLTVTFKNVRWKGKDDLFSFLLNLRGAEQKMEMRIYEVALAQPEPEEPEDPGDSIPDDFGSGGFDGGYVGGGDAFGSSDPVKINSATPNLIVTQYSYGKGSVKAGTSFELELEFKNTSKSLTVENIVMSVEPEGGLSIADGSNTFYFESVPPQATKTLKLKMNAATPENGASPLVNIGFRYEYVDNDQRSEKSSAEKIAIPVVQKDRMEITEPSLTEPAFVGQEFVLSFPYVNKGKGTLYNVALKAEGEGFSTLVPVQNLGNFESGKSGTMDMVIIPEQPGELKLKVIITYENAEEKEIKKEYPITLMVSENIVPEMPPEEMDPGMPEQSGSNWIWWVAGIAIAAAAGFFFWRKKKKKKTAQPEQDLESYFDDSAQDTPDESKDDQNAL